MNDTNKHETDPRYSAIKPGIKTGYEVGRTYVMNIPPGWILVGTIAATDGVTFAVQDGVYVEGINDSYSALGSIAMAKSAKEMKAAVSRCYPVPDGYQVRCDAVLISVPCERDVTPLSRQEDAASIKRAAGK